MRTINENGIVGLYLDLSFLIKLKSNILKAIMLKRAYKGYCAWLKFEDDGITPNEYSEFKQFEFWKIHLAFRQYFAWCLGGDFNDTRLKFKNLILNKK